MNICVCSQGVWQNALLIPFLMFVSTSTGKVTWDRIWKWSLIHHLVNYLSCLSFPSPLTINEWSITIAQLRGKRTLEVKHRHADLSSTIYQLCDFRLVALEPWDLVSSLGNENKESMRNTCKVLSTLPGTYKHSTQTLPGNCYTEGTCCPLGGSPDESGSDLAHMQELPILSGHGHLPKSPLLHNPPSISPWLCTSFPHWTRHSSRARNLSWGFNLVGLPFPPTCTTISWKE